MTKKKYSKITAWILSAMMVFTMTPSIAFAGETDIEAAASDEETAVTMEVEEGEPAEEPVVEENHAPVLAEGVTDETGQVITGEAYLLKKLQAGKIFTDPDGDKLDITSYFYERSTDGGQTWEKEVSFAEALFGMTTIQMTENQPGTYVYRFFAKDSKGASSADNGDYWTLTLKVVDEALWDTKIYVSQDQNYAANGNVYPELRVYKTAGVNKDKKSREYNFDYVGTYEKNGHTEYVYDPADFIITGSAEDGWKIKESEDGPEYTLKNFEPVSFTDSSFGTDENGEKSGTVINNYNMFYASIVNGDYSFRGYGYNTETKNYDIKLGGMKVKVPTDSNVDGNAGGGTDLYFRVSAIYTSSKKTDGTAFTADEYHAAFVCPIMGCTAQPGTPYVVSGTTYYPFLAYAGGNSCLYNRYVYPDIEGYMFGQAINATIPTGYTLNRTAAIALSEATKVEATVPEDAEFNLYFQVNNFNTNAVEPMGEAVDNGDGTKTLSFQVSKGNANYTWRLEDPAGKYVTKAGWIDKTAGEMKLNFTFDEDSATNRKSHSFANLGKVVASRDEADIQVNLDPTGYKAVGSDESRRVRAYRHWEIINSDTANIMIEPDYNWTVLNGNADIKTVDGGNTSDNWADIDPKGTAIVAVNYDAIDAYTNNDATDYGTHGGLYPATQPNRTGVVVLSDTEKGNAIAHIKYNSDGSKQTRSEEWDYNYDTWYYDSNDESPVLDFTVEGKDVSKVQIAKVTTNKALSTKMSAWQTVSTDENGNYQADISGMGDGGTVIIKMKDSTGVSYSLVRVAKVVVTAKNATNPGEDIMPGDEVELSFNGLYRSVNKISGVFNPTTFYARYSSNGTEVNGTLGQYQKMDNATINLTVPENIQFKDGEDTAEYVFDNGYVFGSMYSAANPFAFLYGMTDTGVGTNFNAVTVSFCLQHLADVNVTVHKSRTINLKLAVTDGENVIEDASVILKNPAGNAVEAAEGAYNGLSYGKYSYEISKDGFQTAKGSFSLGGEDVADEEGFVTKTVKLTKMPEGAWDGTSKSEPALVDGVYQIGTGAELAWFTASVNGGKTGIKAKLTDDIELGGNEWTPIGNNTKKFAGSFDGDGHKIKGLSINVDAKAKADAPYKGLFGSVAGTAASHAVIKNVKIGGEIKVKCSDSVANAYVGGLCGLASYADIDNVVSAVDVSVTRTTGNWSYVGGITGSATNGTAITKCAYAGTVSAYNYAGGISGYIAGSTIDSCTNDGSISGNNYIGGITGNLNDGTSKVINSYNTGEIAGNDYVGGVAGRMYTGSGMANCFNYSDVAGSGSNAGNLTGYIHKSAIVTNCYLLECDMKSAGTVNADVAPEIEAVNKSEFLSAQMLSNLNKDGNIFTAGNEHPVFGWFSQWTGSSDCNHKLKKVSAVNAACTKDGMAEYWICRTCDKMFADEEGTTETSMSALKIKAHGLKKVDASEATCTEDGHEAYYKCKDKTCGKIFRDADGTERIKLEDLTIPATGHKLVKTEAVSASSTEEGVAAYWTCDVCGDMFSDAEGKNQIHSPSAVQPLGSVTLSAKSYEYNGKVRKPSVIVKAENGETVPASEYTVSYAGGCKNVGTYKVTVTFQNNYSGSEGLTYDINPMKTYVRKLKAGKGKITVKMKKRTAQVTGYQIMYSADPQFKTSKTVNAAGAKKANKKIKKLSKKTKYYFKVRTYKTVNGKTYTSGWSKVKAKKTK